MHPSTASSQSRATHRAQPSDSAAQLVGKWSLAYLAEHFGGFREHSVHVVPKDTAGFARHYGEGLGKGGVMPMSFREFYDKVAAEHLPGASKQALWKYYLQTPLVWFDEELAPGGESNVKGPMRKAPFSAQLEADVTSLGWDWLTQVCTPTPPQTVHRPCSYRRVCRWLLLTAAHPVRSGRQACETASGTSTGSRDQSWAGTHFPVPKREFPFRTCQMWAGHGGSCTPCHYDSLCNFLSQASHPPPPPRQRRAPAGGSCGRPTGRRRGQRLPAAAEPFRSDPIALARAQVEGRKHVLLFPPSQTYNLYPHPVAHQMDNFTIADPEAPDTERFPALARARALETTLTPGEVLWLPRFWWHLVRQLDAGKPNLSLNFWVGYKGTHGFMQELRSKVGWGPLLRLAHCSAWPIAPPSRRRGLRPQSAAIPPKPAAATMATWPLRPTRP
jgi:hypothetical protein